MGGLRNDPRLDTALPEKKKRPNETRADCLPRDEDKERRIAKNPRHQLGVSRNGHRLPIEELTWLKSDFKEGKGATEGKNAPHKETPRR